VPRLLVGLTSVSVAMVTLSCSDATSPAVTRQFEAAVAATNSTMPFLPNTHINVIAALDNTYLSPTALNDWGEVVGWGNGGSGTSSQAFKWEETRGLTLRGNGNYADSLSSMCGTCVLSHRSALHVRRMGSTMPA
jgi:hypothetical protein